MALSANTVWEIRTTGSETNGGAFVTGASGTDRSQQNAAHATLTTASTVHTTTTQINVAVGDYTVIAADIGNILQITGGTATAGFYQITAVDTGNNRWTVDRAAGTSGQTVAGAMGGALASLGKMGSAAYQAGNKVWIKSGTYSVTSASTNVAGGCFQSLSTGLVIEGYNSTRGDLGTKPLIQASGISSFTLIYFSTNSPHDIINLKFDGASLSGSKALSIRHRAYLCEFVNFVGGAVTSDASTGLVVKCSATGCSGQAAFSAVNCIGCVAFNNTVAGFSSTSQNFFIDCISDSNSGVSTDGFTSTTGSSISGVFLNCTSYNSGRDGFRVSDNRGGFIINCIAEDNAGYGYSIVNVPCIKLVNCAGYSNTSGEVNLGTSYSVTNEGFITGTSSFFVDAPNQNFALNNTAGGGAAVRAQGLPNVFPQMTTTTTYLDVGAVQHQDSGGGGGGATSVAYFG